MRNITVKEWTIIGKDGKEAKEDTLIVLNVLVSLTDPKDMPRGFEQFKLFNKLSNAFDKAKETKVLTLEEDTYKFLKESVNKNIPSTWGASKDIYEAIDAFMNTREE